MIRMIDSKSAASAKAYFTESLVKADYYLEGQSQELQGRFHGRLAERLGIAGPATKDVFVALCENRHPTTGAPLTPRTKDERLVGWDINFHLPKSVSIIAALSKDNHIHEALQESVLDVMREIEAESKTRVRKGGIYGDRSSGELAYCTFLHTTARPVKGHVPDMHSHIHVFTFNATWDEKEQRIKAAKWRDIKKNMPMYQAMFHKIMADKLVALGYQIRRTKSAYEIEGVPQAVIDHFSKRTDEIGRAAKQLGITDADALSALGARTRSKKEKGLTLSELKEKWRHQIRALDIADDGDMPVRFASGRATKKNSPQQFIDYAVQHCFERASVMDEKQLLRIAYRQALGHNVTVEDIAACLRQDPRLIRIQQGSRTLCTTQEALAEEMRMVELARDGRGVMTPLYKVPPELTLTGQQGNAAKHVLTTKNRVSIVMGAAGTGKTRMMRETIAKIKETGKRVYVVAPTAEAARGVLKSEGFDKAETVAKFLNDPMMKKYLKDQVLWVDESGLLSTRDMLRLLELAKDKNARLILGGDTRQHASVVRGDALRVLNTVGGIKAAEINVIRRQENLTYRNAVQDLADGKVKEAFDKLDKIGAIKTIDPLSPHEQLVTDYVAAVKKKQSALVVCPTHKEGERVTAAIREKLRDAGLIAKSKITIGRLENLNMTEAEKSDSFSYQPGQVVHFNQNLTEIKRGSTWTVKKVEANKVQIVNEKGRTTSLPKTKGEYFDVYYKKEMNISKGDRVRITRNAFDESQTQKRLNNGMTLDVVSLNKNGKMLLRNKQSKTNYIVDREFGHLAHAHVITSHASQGKTVDKVFIYQPTAAFGATNAKQFYVSASRGKHEVHIYTDDKEALQEHAAAAGDRQSALELVSAGDKHKAHVEQKQRSDISKQPTKAAEKTKQPQKTMTKPRSYEPEI